NGASQIAVICEYFGGQAPFYDNIWPHSASLEGMYQDSATGLRGYISDDQLKSLTEIPQCWTSANRTQYTDCASGGGTGVDSLPVYVRVGPYNVNPETVFQSASVISHEYGHHLGLPDFYNSSAEVYGDLNLMAADYSQHMTIFGKQEMGWVVPEFLDPGETRNVSGWNEIKNDTGTITWQKPNGEIYTLSAANGDQNIHNGQAYALKLGGRQLIDPGDIPSGTHAWWSGRGNDFGCSPSGAHNLDIALPELAAFDPGTTVTVEFESSWDIEWDYDYGFVLTTTDGVFYTSHASQNGYTTTNDFNPNSNGCMTELNNGLTGTSGAYEQGVETVARAPLANDYSHGAPFLADAYDISDLAGNAGAVLRFSYSTDPGFDRPGWFIDDVVVRADGQVIYSSDFEDTDDLYRYTTDGWNRVNASDDNPADHAYYLELRDQSGFDFDGHGQSDRGDTAWQPGIFIDYTDEAHGYGNNGTPPPPAQHYLDSQPIPGSDCVDEQTGNCQDVSFTSAAGDDFFTDAINAEQPEGFINSFDDPNSKYGDGFWHFDYGCLTLDVTSMSGQDIGPVSPAYGNLTADAVISAGEGCTAFGYGAGDNLPPTAVAQARPTETTVNSPVTFDGSGSYDDRQTAFELTYGWDFGDDTTATGQSVVHSYDAEGVYTATLTVTDLDGASSTDTVTVTVDNSNTGDDTCRNDLCADKEKPQELTLTFVGGSCADSANSQGKKADCWDHEQGGASGDVFIRATNKEDPSYDNAKVWFEGDVADGGQFTLQAALEDEDDFGSKVFIHIYDGEGGTLLQTVEIHTSCSVPLIEGEQFGSLTLGGSEVDPDQPVCSKGEGRVHGSGHWDRATEEKYDKVDFSFDAKHYKGALKGKLKVHDKGMDFKIDAK
ncbi:MAG: PKD domain-containing protein, partial [Acidimicrobiia bacterium]|nr:PKD domain-containing protein [Acidimicrobiia bacterium]